MGWVASRLLECRADGGADLTRVPGGEPEQVCFGARRKCTGSIGATLRHRRRASRHFTGQGFLIRSAPGPWRAPKGDVFLAKKDKSVAEFKIISEVMKIQSCVPRVEASSPIGPLRVVCGICLKCQNPLRENTVTESEFKALKAESLDPNGHSWGTLDAAGYFFVKLYRGPLGKAPEKETATLLLPSLDIKIPG